MNKKRIKQVEKYKPKNIITLFIHLSLKMVKKYNENYSFFLYTQRSFEMISLL